MALENDYPEDTALENGNYQSKCYRCSTVFMGHKRRFICRVCATPKTLLQRITAWIDRQFPNR